MNIMALTRMAVVSAGLVLAAGFAQAAEPANPHVPLAKTIGKPSAQAPVPSLGVINAKSATLADGKLVLDVAKAGTAVGEAVHVPRGLLS